MDPDDNVVAFSRNGSTSVFGKLDDRIESFRIESIVKSAFAQVASQKFGMPAVEFARFVMRIIAFGPAQVKRMHSHQVDEVVKLLGGLVGQENNGEWKDE